MTIQYDPTGTLASNTITNEIHNSITECDVYPTNSPFFKTGLVVTGIPVNSSTVTTLAEFTDYVMSPLFATRSADTGKEVYSYILLINYAGWSSIALSYQAVGGDPDTVLYTEITNAGNFDRTDINIWDSFIGELGTINQSGSIYGLENTTTISILSNKLNQIALALQTPNGYKDTIDNQLLTFNSTVSSLQSEVNSLQTALNTLTGNSAGSTTLTQAPYVSKVGDIKLVSKTSGTADTGWVLCDGSPYSTTSPYDTLYSVIGTTYNQTGVAANHFNVPNISPIVDNTNGTSATLPYQICFTPSYVNYIKIVTTNVNIFVSPSGSDSNDGITPTTPVNTFAKAVEIAQNYYPLNTAGTTAAIYINLLQGSSSANTYSAVDIINAPSQTNIIIQGYVSASVSGGTLTVTHASDPSKVILDGGILVTTREVTFQYLQVQDTTDANNPIAIHVGAAGQVVIGNGVYFGPCGAQQAGTASLVNGQEYYISDLGNGTTATWSALGIPNTETVTVGYWFVANFTTRPTTSAKFIPNGAHVGALQGGNIVYGNGVSGSITTTIVGNAGNHIRSIQDGNVTVNYPTINVIAGSSFICNAFAYADTNANIITLGATINTGGSYGSVVGKRYKTGTSGIITVPNSDVNFFPGSTDGKSYPSMAYGALVQATTTVMGIAKTAAQSILAALSGTDDLTDNTSIVTPQALTFGIRFGTDFTPTVQSYPWIASTYTANGYIVGAVLHIPTPPAFANGASYTVNSSTTITGTGIASNTHVTTAGVTSGGWSTYNINTSQSVGSSGSPIAITLSTLGTPFQSAQTRWYVQLPVWLGSYLIQGGYWMAPTGMGDKVTYLRPFTSDIYTLISSDQGPGSRITGVTSNPPDLVTGTWPGCNPSGNTFVIPSPGYPTSGFASVPTVNELTEFLVYAFLPEISALSTTTSAVGYLQNYLTTNVGWIAVGK